MPSRAAPARLCQPLASPVAVPAEQAFVVPLDFDAARATAAAREAIVGSFLRPYDIGDAEIEPAVLAWVPFWRIDLTADGFHVGISSVSIGREGGISLPIPVGGSRHRDAVLLVTARRLFPYEPRLVHVPGSPFASDGSAAFGTFEIPLDAMRPRASYTIPDGEIVEPDVSREAAEQEARSKILRSVEPRSAIYAKYKPEIRSVGFVQHPLYVARYTYGGHARGKAGEAFHVVISGRTGEVAGGRHPPALKALARKFSRLFAR